MGEFILLKEFSEFFVNIKSEKNMMDGPNLTMIFCEGNPQSLDFLTYCSEALASAAQSLNIAYKIPNFRYCLTCGLKIVEKAVQTLIEEGIWSKKCTRCKTPVSLD